MDGPHKQEFHVRNLPTRSVTLFPSRAQIVRDIKDVTLKPGANEITVVGLTPTVDEHSIKVEGTGSAIITDITVELLPNRDIFDEIYPDSDSDLEKDGSEDDDDDEDEADAAGAGADKVSSALEAVREKLVALRDQQKRAKELIASAESRLKVLDSYATSLDCKSGVDIEASLETYRKEREKVFNDHMEGTARDRELAKEIEKLRPEEARLEKLQAKEVRKAAKQKAKSRRAREKLRDKKRRRDAERDKEKARIRRERDQFWPRACYTVRISLDAGANLTPGSSRRTSISSAADVQLASDQAPTKEGEAGAAVACDLTLSYVTSSAFWAPSYDLALSSTTNTATLCFDARLTNMTSETWSNCKVTLSTSQAHFSGLQDDAPALVPWRLKLVGKGDRWDGLDIVHSREERAEKNLWNAAQHARAQQKPRADLFGAPQHKELARRSQLDVPPAQLNVFGFQRPVPAAAPASNPLGDAPPAASVPAPAMAASSSAPPIFGVDAPAGSQGLSYSGSNDEDADADAQTMLEAMPEVTFQDSSFEETGLTATYDLPHLKTLRPSATASKQRVARIAFTNVAFTRTVVAKYKPAAYLRARLRNTSKLTLLRGPAGLTLDGTFLGRATLPRCSAGDAFAMPLGVDPAIRVAYPKPEVARSTTGVFSKGETSVYTRAVTLVNTRAAAGTPVSLTVLDQVPVPEDEKIRVEVLQPAGLQRDGGRAGVAAGVPGREGKDELDWGRATASLRKAGEVAWDVVLNAGKSVKLVLQYEVSFPTGERVAQVQ
ncbi:1b4e9f36-a589-48ea-98f2-e1969fde7dbd [Thermothielavioides terrestris]|uniref:1b4e9f36-a589-48ea-98f2-e1969fde7dbd n=1 Tax=Thermothielavioides terrestris TaxID=2587410 RepID=A0A446BMZ6_9PEZI|nr:1b4e9f36-a589-48ea-98f2-e1969fde7dbd [Thermothielavioides terrestris]